MIDVRISHYLYKLSACQGSILTTMAQSVSRLVTTMWKGTIEVNSGRQINGYLRIWTVED